MSKEFLELLTAQGERTGHYKTRNEIHQTGEWHLSVHIWLADGNMVLFQKRADTKESYPGLFDASAAGHVSAGESCAQAALRETQEELGVTLSEEQLRLLGVRRLCILDESRAFRSNEFNSIYLARVDAGHCQIRPSPDEISSVVWVDVGNLRADLEASVPGYCVAPEEMCMVEEALMTSPEKAVREDGPFF